MTNNDINSKRFTLRLDLETFEQIKQVAQQNRRSTAKQIQFILDNFLKKGE